MPPGSRSNQPPFAPEDAHVPEAGAKAMPVTSLRHTPPQPVYYWRELRTASGRRAPAREAGPPQTKPPQRLESNSGAAALSRVPPARPQSLLLLAGVRCYV